MSMLNKIKSALKGREDTVRKVVDKAGTALNQRTGNKYHKQVSQVQKRSTSSYAPTPIVLAD